MADQSDPRYGKLDSEIVTVLENLEYTNFREDTPVPFNGLLIYPATVRDYELFSNCTTCLTLNKNEDPKGITMTHLDYLIKKMQDEKEGQF